MREFARRTPEGRRKRFIHAIDSKWCEELSRYLGGIRTTRNGGPATELNPERPMGPKQKREILRCFRGVIEFARLRTPALVPPDFRNPLSKKLIGRAPKRGNGLSDPPVSVENSTKLVRVFDAYQLGLLGPLFLYGPRPSELGHILREDYDDANGSLHMRPRPDTGYTTKGDCAKFWPVTDALLACIGPFLGRTSGPLFIKRRIFEGKSRPSGTCRRSSATSRPTRPPAISAS